MTILKPASFWDFIVFFLFFFFGNLLGSCLKTKQSKDSQYLHATRKLHSDRAAVQHIKKLLEGKFRHEMDQILYPLSSVCTTFDIFEFLPSRCFTFFGSSCKIS